MLDRIFEHKTKELSSGHQSLVRHHRIIDAEREGEYYVLSVSSPEEAGLALKKVVEKGVLVTEMRQLDNPLQELFDTPSTGKRQETKNAE